MNVITQLEFELVYYDVSVQLPPHRDSLLLRWKGAFFKNLFTGSELCEESFFVNAYGKLTLSLPSLSDMTHQFAPNHSFSFFLTVHLFANSSFAWAYLFTGNSQSKILQTKPGTIRQLSTVELSNHRQPSNCFTHLMTEMYTLSIVLIPKITFFIIYV